MGFLNNNNNDTPLPDFLPDELRDDVFDEEDEASENEVTPENPEDFIISKDTPIYKIIELDSGNAAILMASGMACITCPASYMETLEQACYVHGMGPDDIEMMVEDINYYMAKKHGFLTDEDTEKNETEKSDAE